MWPVKVTDAREAFFGVKHECDAFKTRTITVVCNVIFFVQKNRFIVACASFNLTH